MKIGDVPSWDLSVDALTPDQICALYRERLIDDFPPDELKPLLMIDTALAAGYYMRYGAQCGRETLAYAFLVQRGRLALLDYYAVRRDLRDRGVGSAFIQALIAGVMGEYDCALLEVEDPDRAPDSVERDRRLRRLQFYFRNGLSDTGVRTLVYGVPYSVLSLPVGRTTSSEDVKRVYELLYRTVLPSRLYETCILL